MRSARFAWIAVAACAAVAAWGVYAPAGADRWLPAAGPLAHRLHDRIWAPPAQTAAAPGAGEPGAPAGAAPIVVTVTAVKRFQTRHHLAATGAMNVGTWRALLAATR